MSILTSGMRGVYISPFDFVNDPLLWIRAMSKYQAKSSNSPNFGLRLVVKAWKKLKTELDLNLSSMKTIGCGGEPIQPQACLEFTSLLAPYGFSSNCIIAGYGQAEHVLTMCQYRLNTSSLETLNLSKATDPVQGLMGYAQDNRFSHDIRIVDTGTKLERCVGEIGEIWVNSPCCANGGYLNKLDLTVETFEAELATAPGRKYLRTGDLGFLNSDGMLFICGRFKDIIIINGENIYPQDLEFVVEEICPEVIRTGCVAVVRTTYDAPGGGGMVEGVDAIAEVKITDCPHSVYDRISQDICKAVSLASPGVRVYNVYFIPPRTISKTSSGKIQRAANRARVISQDLQVIHHRGRMSNPANVRHDIDVRAASSNAIPTTKAEVRDIILQRICTNGNLEVAPDLLGAMSTCSMTVESLGLDSLSVVELCQSFAELFCIEVSPAEIYQCKFVEDLVNAVCRKLFVETFDLPINVEEVAPSVLSFAAEEVHSTIEQEAGGVSAQFYFRFFMFAVAQLFGLFAMLWIFSALFTPCYILLEHFIDQSKSPFLMTILRYDIKPTLGSADAYQATLRKAYGDFFSIPYWHYPTSDPWISNIHVGIAVGSALMGQVFVLMIAASSILLKWVVVGRVAPGAYPLYGLYHFRLWFASAFIDLGAGLLAFYFPDTPVLLLFNRLLGTSISCDGVNIDSIAHLAPMAWDVVVVEAGSKISSSAMLTPVCIKEGNLVIEAMHIGSQCDIRDNAIVPSGSSLASHTILSEMRVYNSNDDHVLGTYQFPAFRYETIVYGLTWLMLNFALTATCIAVGVAVVLRLKDLTACFSALIGMLLLSAIYFVVAWAAVTWIFKCVLRRLHPSKIWSGLLWLTLRKMFLRMHGVLDRTLWRFFWGAGLNTLWYKSLGANIGKDSALSMHVGMDDPECITIGEKCLFGGGCLLRTSESLPSGDTAQRDLRIENNSLVSQKTIVGISSVIKEHASVLPYTVVPDDTAVAEYCVFGGETKGSRFSEYHSYTNMPNVHMELWGCMMHLVILVWILSLVFVGIVAALSTGYALSRLHAPASLQQPAALFVFISVVLLCVIISKWVLVGHRSARDNIVIGLSIQSIFQTFAFYLSTTLHNTMCPMLGWWMIGTPWMVLYLRLLGAKVACSAWIGSYWLYDWDLIEIRDGAIVELHATVSPHVMNSIRDVEFKPVVVAERGTLQTNALAIGGSMVKAGQTIAPNTRAVFHVKLDTQLTSSKQSESLFQAFCLESSFPYTFPQQLKALLVILTGLVLWYSVNAFCMSSNHYTGAIAILVSIAYAVSIGTLLFAVTVKRSSYYYGLACGCCLIFMMISFQQGLYWSLYSSCDSSTSSPSMYPSFEVTVRSNIFNFITSSLLSAIAY